MPGGRKKIIKLTLKVNDSIGLKKLKKETNNFL